MRSEEKKLTADFLKNLSQSDRQEIIPLLLDGLEQPWSYGLFCAINAVVPLAGIEVLVLRRNKKTGEIEVLLTRRPPDDPHWPDCWHVPGTVLRNTDNGYAEAFSRIEAGELKTKLTSFGQCGTVFWRHQRGPSVSIVFLFQLKDGDSQPPVGQFFPVNNLPENLLGGHDKVIRPAVMRFMQINL